MFDLPQVKENLSPLSSPKIADKSIKAVKPFCSSVTKCQAHQTCVNIGALSGNQ